MARGWYSWMALACLAWTRSFLVGGRDVNPQQEHYVPDYTVYHNLSQIDKHVEQLAAAYPNFLRLERMYQSREKRSQPLLRFTNFTDSRLTSATSQLPVPKVKILLSYGEHAREFLPIESLFRLLGNLTDGLSAPRGSHAERFSSTVATNIDLFIIVMMNPDGRHYVEQTQNYCWRGTSTGVDLNRNFDWYFGNRGSSGKKEDEEYRGTRPFSEPECRVLTELTSKYHFDAFVSFHSGIKHIYIPYADTVSKRLHRKPENLESMLELADAMSHATRYKYAYGMAYQVNEYTADGTVFDYMAGVRKIPFSFVIEMWGEGDHDGAKCFDLFNPPNQELRDTLHELHPLYEALFTYLVSWKSKQHMELMNSVMGSWCPEHNFKYQHGYDSMDAPSLTFGLVLLCLTVLVTLCVAVHNRLPPCLRIYPRRRIVSLRALSSTFSLLKM